MMNNRADFRRVLAAVQKGEMANDAASGLKFVGRVEECRKSCQVVNEETGAKHIEYHLTAAGFQEMESTFFYDLNLATNEVVRQNVGRWLTRAGVSVDIWLDEQSKEHPEENNVNRIIPRILDLVVGSGAAGQVNPASDQGLAAAHGAGTEENAPNAYMVPPGVGDLLGLDTDEGDGRPPSYADILTLLQGVQQYDGGEGLKAFTPRLDDDRRNWNRYVCPDPMLGTFYPSALNLINRPLWSVLRQYLNPAVNEMYTCLRVTPDGKSIMPTLVLRQIPFTTDAFPGGSTSLGSSSEREGDELSAAEGESQLKATRFMSLPRWVLPESLCWGYDVGRSDAARINFVHVYGVAPSQSRTFSIGDQMVHDPPIIDDLDVMRSGMRPLMMTVECAIDDVVNHAAGRWMRLIADWQIGMHLTFNGTVSAAGIQAPIAEGDNLQFGDVVYHIEGLVDVCTQDGEGGKKRWRTQLQLSNGTVETTGKFPGYPMVEGDGDPTAAADPQAESF
jgi:hypothetical protein